MKNKNIKKVIGNYYDIMYNVFSDYSSICFK